MTLRLLEEGVGYFLYCTPANFNFKRRKNKSPFYLFSHIKVREKNCALPEAVKNLKKMILL